MEIKKLNQNWHKYLFYWLCLFSSSCTRGNAGPEANLIYDSTPVVRLLQPIINEISGIADSKLNLGYLWAEEDSGNPPQLHLISHTGKLEKTIYIKGAINRDWEDLQLANGKLYVGDIGDNNRVYDEYSFYCFNEPLISVDTVRSFEKIRFSYEDGPHDAEAFFVDPQTQDIYIITKRDNPSLIYKISYPYSTSSLNTAAKIGSLPFTGVVSATFSPKANEILIKTYVTIARFERRPGESILQSLQSSPITIQGYKVEPLGEAIAFKLDNTGFFTISEKGFASSVNLYFYSRK